MSKENTDRANLSLMPKLKEMVVTADDFMTVWTYFLDHFGENPAFLDLGAPTKSPFIEAIIRQVGGQIFKREPTLNNLFLIHVPEQKFIHGGFVLNGKISGIIYFEDIQWGIISVSMSLGGHTEFSRFSAKQVANPNRRHRN